MKRWFRTGRTLLALVALALALPWNVRAQDPPPTFAITYVDTSAYPQIKVYVAPTRSAPLDPAQLKIKEDERDVTLATAPKPETTGVAVAVLIDTSRSMRGRGLADPARPELAFLSRLDTARSAAGALAKALAPGKDMLGVFTFNETVQPLRKVVSDGSNGTSCQAQPQPIAPVDGQNVADSLISCLENLAPAVKRSKDEILKDPYSYSALNTAILHAATALSDTIALDADRQSWQRVIVALGDSCDDIDTRKDTIGSKAQICAPQGNITQLLDTHQNNLSIFGIGLGDTDVKRATPPSPDANPAYEARLDLLKAYGDKSPHGGFLQLAAGDPGQAQTQWDAFRQQVIAPILARRQQFVLTFTSQPSSWSQTHGRRQLTVTSGTASATAAFDERPVAPAFKLVPDENANVIHPQFTNNIQGQITRVDYYGDGKLLSAVKSDPFDLPFAQLITGTEVITATAFEQIGGKEVSAPAANSLAAACCITIQATPVPTLTPTPIPPPPVPQKSLLWIILLLAATALVIATIFLLWRRRPVIAPMPQIPSGPFRETLGMFPASALGPGTAVLRVISGAEPGKEYPLLGKDMFIGASTNLAELVLDDDYVSSRHARLWPDGETLEVEDLNSKNHTYINNRMLKPGERQQLGPSDLLTVGRTTLQWLPRGAAADVPAPASPPTHGNQRATEEIIVPRQEHRS